VTKAPRPARETAIRKPPLAVPRGATGRWFSKQWGSAQPAEASRALSLSTESSGRNPEPAAAGRVSWPRLGGCPRRTPGRSGHLNTKGGRKLAVQKAIASTSLAEVVDRILDKGVVIDAWVRVSLVGIELLAIEARVVVAGVDTWLKYAEAAGLTSEAAA